MKCSNTRQAIIVIQPSEVLNTATSFYPISKGLFINNVYGQGGKETLQKVPCPF